MILTTSVREAELAMLRRVGVSEESTFDTQGNLANSYQMLGRLDEALRIRRDVYSGRLRLSGEEHGETLRVANNYAMNLLGLERFEEAKSLLRKTLPVARRVLGENDELILILRWNYAMLYEDPAATHDDLREAVETLEDAGQIAQRVLGDAHPITGGIGGDLRRARAALYARGLP